MPRSRAGTESQGEAKHPAKGEKDHGTDTPHRVLPGSARRSRAQARPGRSRRRRRRPRARNTGNPRPGRLRRRPRARGLQALLEVEADIAVIGSVSDGKEVLDLVRQLRPDVLLMHTTPTDVNGLELARQLAADPDASGVSLLILGASERDEEIFATLRAGASGFLLRDTGPAGLIDGIRAVAAGDTALSPRVTGRLVAELATRPDPGLPDPQQLGELTPRELEVMALVAAGLTNVDIAEELVISRATAKTHVSRVLRKLH